MQPSEPSQPALPGAPTPERAGDPTVPSRPPVSFRSVSLGIAGVALICGLTPYNDYVLNNTYLVGNYLPIGLVLIVLVLVLLVNAPLWRWAPRQALQSGELAVVLGMLLVSSTLPSSGLMRYFPAHLISFFYQAAPGGDALRVLQEADLPDWLFPRMEAEAIQERANDPVVRDFWTRIWVEQPGFIAQFRAVPWGAWARPLFTWGALLAALYGSILCMAAIVYRQWVENERLAFPLAQVYLSLIESPQPHRALNALFSARSFWFAFAAVFLVHGFNGMHLYHPGIWPRIPIGFDLHDVFSEGVWRFTEQRFKWQTLYFSMIGIAFFMQTKIAFSLWALYVLYNVVLMWIGPFHRDVTRGMQYDQTFGALVVFGVFIIWIGREHWMLVLRQMFRGAARDEPEGRFLPYAAAGWGLIGCASAMVTWLWLAGVDAGGAILLVLLLLLLFLSIARVVAETGLIFAGIPMPLIRPWVYLLHDLPQAMAVRTGFRTYFFSSSFYVLFTADMRESLPPYKTHALRIADTAAYAGKGNWRRGILFMGVLVLALCVGFAVAGAATLYVNYSHGTSKDRAQLTPINPYGTHGAAYHVIFETRDFIPPGTGPRETHARLGHLTFGAAVTGAFTALHLRYVSWPFHPVGFLLIYSYPIRMIWASVFIGWLAKGMIVRYGGWKLLHQARPVFIGLIIGEAAAAACWLLVSVVLSVLGMEYHTVRLLPG